MTFSSVDAGDQISVVECLQFVFGNIRVATQNFSDANKLGEGGFGTVYKVMPKINDFQNKLWYFMKCVLFNNDMIFIKKIMYK